MIQSTSKDRLKDKFSKVEISIDDDRFVHKLDQSSIEKLSAIKKTKKRPMIWLSLFKIIKITLENFSKSSKDKCTRSMQEVFLRGKTIFTRVTSFIRNREEQAELLLQNKINKFEMVKRELKEYEELGKKNREILIEDYRSHVSDAFLNYLDDRNFPISIKDYVSLGPLITYQMKLMDTMSSKLNSSNMIVNVLKINMSLYAEGDEAVSRVYFELDKKGHLWSIMFGKIIVPDVNNLLVDRQGKIAIKQVCNTATNRDLFTVEIRYKLKLKDKSMPLLTSLDRVVNGDIVV